MGLSVGINVGLLVVGDMLGTAVSGLRVTGGLATGLSAED